MMDQTPLDGCRWLVACHLALKVRMSLIVKEGKKVRGDMGQTRMTNLFLITNLIFLPWTLCI